MSMDFILGGPARGEDFYFRKMFLSDLWQSLNKNNVLLVAPRRMGKTSIMFNLLDEPREEFLVVYLNVEALETPSEFIIQLIFALRESQPDYFFERLGMIWGLYKNIIRNTRSPEFFELKESLRKELDWDRHWQDQASQLINGMQKINQPILLMIDELPDMFIRMQKKSPETFETFLHWFRIVRQSPNSPLRWLVAGSTNLIGSLDQLGHARLINDFFHLDLPPFSAQEVELFVTKAFEEHMVDYDPKVIVVMQELLGNAIPFFLQLLTKELILHWKSNGGDPIDKAMVKSVFEKGLLGNRALSHLQHFRSRIDFYYPEEERTAVYTLLDELSSTEGMHLKNLFARYAKLEEEKPSPRDERTLTSAFSRLLLLLQTDFYVEDMGGRKYDFSNRLIKQWWNKYYGT